MNPIFLEPVLKDYIWGGSNLKTKFNRKTELDKVAESWEISANKNGKNIIKDGEFNGKTIDELFNDESVKEEIFGKNCRNLSEFPILIKFIDAQSSLSVQVHPDDEYAKKQENSQGKSEMWYIMDCKENAKLVCGLNSNGKSVKDIIENDEIEEHLNLVDVKKGDYVYIKAGTVHAILDGILICEIQQNSDITYRLFDWNRVDKDGKPRQLHKEKAIDVINLNNSVQVKHTFEKQGVQAIIHCDKFMTDLVTISESDSYKDTTDELSFYAYNVIDGNGFIEVNKSRYNLSMGDSFIIPASTGKYEICGNMKLLKTHI